MIENTQCLYVLEMNNGHRFQSELAKFAMKNGYKKIVETGYGVSTVHFLYWMKHTLDMEEGMVYSIDKSPWYPNRIHSPQHVLIEGKSIDEILPLYLKIGAWDLFIHDGCHNGKDMLYDLEMGYACLRKGGVIACDDYSWNNGGAWDYFVLKNELNVEKMGDIAYAVKESDEVLRRDTAEYFSNKVLEEATNRENAWLAQGNENHPVFN